MLGAYRSSEAPSCNHSLTRFLSSSASCRSLRLILRAHSSALFSATKRRALLNFKLFAPEISYVINGLTICRALFVFFDLCERVIERYEIAEVISVFLLITPNRGLASAKKRENGVREHFPTILWVQ